MTDHGDDIWSSARVAKEVKRSVYTLHRWRKAGTFPQPLERASKNAPYEWDRRVVERWLRNRGLKVG